MELDWSEADPAHFLAPLVGLAVDIDGSDYEVVAITGEGVTVQQWDDYAAKGIGGSVLVPWDEIGRLFVH